MINVICFLCFSLLYISILSPMKDDEVHTSNSLTLCYNEINEIENLLHENKEKIIIQLYITLFICLLTSFEKEDWYGDPTCWAKFYPKKEENEEYLACVTYYMLKNLNRANKILTQEKITQKEVMRILKVIYEIYRVLECLAPPIKYIHNEEKILEILDETYNKNFCFENIWFEDSLIFQEFFNCILTINKVCIEKLCNLKIYRKIPWTPDNVQELIENDKELILEFSHSLFTNSGKKIKAFYLWKKHEMTRWYLFRQQMLYSMNTINTNFNCINAKFFKTIIQLIASYCEQKGSKDLIDHLINAST